MEQIYDSELDPKAQAFLLESPDLQDPDSPEEVNKIDLSEFGQRQILTQVVLGPPDMMATAYHCLPPDAFEDKAKQSIAWRIGLKCAYEHYKDFGTQPTKGTLIEMVTQRTKDHKHHSAIVGCIVGLMDAPYIEPAAYWKKQICQYAKYAGIRRAFSRLIDGIGKEKFNFDELHDKYNADIEAVKALEIKEDALKALDAITFFEKAAAQPQEWLVDNWLSSGAVVLLSGEKKIGKSTLLQSMIDKLAEGHPWFGIETKACHVVYIDLENPISYVRANMLANRPLEDWRPIASRVLIPEVSPPIVTAEWLTQFVTKNIPAGEHKRTVIFIDSALAAFQGLYVGVKRVWDNTASDVRAALKHLELVARQLGVCIVLIHHDNKQGDTGGSAQWEGGVDFVLQYTTKNSRRVLKAKWGRWTGAKPDSLSFTKPKDKLICQGTAKEAIQSEQVDDEDKKLTDVLRYVPTHDALDTPRTVANTITTQRLAVAVGISESEVRKRLAELLECNKVQREAVPGQTGPGRKEQWYWQCGLI